MSTPSSALVAIFSALSLGGLLAISPPSSDRGAPPVPVLRAVSPSILPLREGAYLTQVVSLLSRYDLAQRQGDRLLTERDADPRLVGDPRWRQDYGRVALEHQGEYVEAQTLAAPSDALEIQDCLTEGLRLTATAEGMFSDAFGADGHRAYYLSAHGNWDLNLGKTTIARCRTALAAWQARHPLPTG